MWEEVVVDVKGLRKATKRLVQNRWSPHRDLKSGPPEYETSVVLGLKFVGSATLTS